MRKKTHSLKVSVLVWMFFLILGIISGGGTIAAAAVSFASAVNYGVGTLPSSVAIGDFNGDGKPDLAVANDSDNVSILLGASNGTFGTATNYATVTGGHPRSVVCGDFNRDGKLDLAVANVNTNNVSILLGAGDGTFGTATNYTVGTGPAYIITGDFNRDGILDLATANTNSDNVSILLGVGDGTFGAASNYAVASGPGPFWPFSVTMGDFNGDGKLDLATANYYSSNVSILLGDGAGAFSAAAGSPYTAGTGPVGVTTGDFNNDGKLDLAVANYNTDDISILIGNGNGTFAAAVNYGTGTGSTPRSVITGDFDGDSKPDLAVANYGTHNVSILPGKGDGTFDTAVNFAAGTSPYAVIAGYFNGDGKPDLAAVNNISSGTVSILLNTTAFSFSGFFAMGVNYGIGTQPNLGTSGDFSGDGNIDVAVANWASNDVSVLLGNGNGTFASAVNYGVGNNPLMVATGDFNGDNKLDLASANGIGNSVSILTGIGDGTFNSALNYTITAPLFVISGDFNRDGKLDLAVIRDSSNISFLPGNGNGTFGTAVNSAAGGGPLFGIAGDFNGDGKLDLALALWTLNQVSILLGNGDGTFTPASGSPITVGTFPMSLTVGDFNRDGKLDLAVANYGSDNISILLGVGDGTFGAAVNYGVNGPRSILSGDFNRDGKLDLAVIDLFSNDLCILTGNGDGTFASAVKYAGGFNPISLISGDFNRDGKLDLAMVRRDPGDAGKVAVMLDGSSVFSGPIISNLQINGGAVYTTSSTVNLTYSTTGSPTHIRYSNGFPDPVTGAYWSSWKTPVPASLNISLGAANGTRDVYVQVKNTSGVSPVAHASIIFDNAAPLGRVKINGGAATVFNTGGTTSVHLHLAMFDRTMSGAMMRVKVGGGGFSGDPDALAPWEAFATSKDVNLIGTGTKTVYVQFKDGVGKKSAVSAPTIVVSNTGAVFQQSTVTVSSLFINGTNAYTTSPSVNLNYDVSDTNVRARYCFINSSGVLSWTAWETPSLSGSTVIRNLTLASGNIPRRVYVQLKENATGKMTDPAYDEIILDTANPGGAVWINNGAASVVKTGDITYVTLTVPAGDTASGLDRMAIYQGTAPVTPSGYDLVSFAPTVVYPLDTSTTGIKNIYLWLRDKAGRLSLRKSDGINVLGP